MWFSKVRFWEQKYYIGGVNILLVEFLGATPVLEDQGGDTSCELVDPINRE